MEITVKYFAAVRELTHQASETIVLEEAEPTVAQLFDALAARYARLEGYRSHLRAAVNREFVGFDHVLRDEDEVAFIPPVSGGADDASSADGRFLVTKRPLEPAALTELVRRPQAGAVITFEGVVRDHTGEREVSYLEYDAYVEMALAKLEQTAHEAKTRWDAVEVAVHHRWGRLEIGEVAVAIAVSSPHRAEAYAASQYVIDRLKEIVPIWKKEVSPDGEEWVGFGP